MGDTDLAHVFIDMCLDHRDAICVMRGSVTHAGYWQGGTLYVTQQTAVAAAIVRDLPSVCQVGGTSVRGADGKLSQSKTELWTPPPGLPTVTRG